MQYMATVDRRKRTAAKPTTQNARPLRALIYVRQSLDRAGEGLAVARQEATCRELAATNGWEVEQVFSDNDVSASSTRKPRPGWQAVLGALQAGRGDVLIAWHVDRMYRQLPDLVALLDVASARADLNIATVKAGNIDLSTPAGRMVATQLASVARYEIEQKSARQVASNEQRAMAGRPMWVRRPFGYERDGSLREVEASVIRQAYSDLLGGRSLSSITRDFTASGLPTTTGAVTWGIATVRTILRAPRNAALSTRYGEIVADATWQPIVEETTWRAADRLLSDPARHRGQGPLANLLSGIAVCDVCGSTVKVNWRGRKGEANSYATYVCSNGGHATLPVDWMDGRIVLELALRAEEVGQTAFAVEDTPDLAPLRAEEATLSDRMDDLAESFAAGEINRRQMGAASAKLRNALEDVQTRIAAAGRTAVWDYVDVEHLFQEFDDLPLETQRAVVRAAYSRIAIKPRGRGRIAPDVKYLGIEWTKEWRTVRKARGKQA